MIDYPSLSSYKKIKKKERNVRRKKWKVGERKHDLNVGGNLCVDVAYCTLGRVGPPRCSKPPTLGPSGVWGCIGLFLLPLSFVRLLGVTESASVCPLQRSVRISGAGCPTSMPSCHLHTSVLRRGIIRGLLAEVSVSVAVNYGRCMARKWGHSLWALLAAGWDQTRL